MKVFSRFFVFAPILVMSGCIWTDVTAPLNPDEQMKHRQSIQPTKGGRACSYAILGVVAFGDHSLGKAVRAGGITTVSSVDQTTSGVPFLFSGKRCTVVEGN